VTAAISSDDFRQALGRFATGVTVITTDADGELHGMTANAFTSVSLVPPLVLVCVERDARMHALLGRRGAFSANILSAQQQALSVWFANAERPGGAAEFADVPWFPAPQGGCPRIVGALAYVDCAVRDVHAGGDHSIFVAEVNAVELGADGEPLLYYRGRYRSLSAAAEQQPGRGA
jgi:flavin reductase